MGLRVGMEVCSEVRCSILQFVVEVRRLEGVWGKDG